jgi:UDP-GlcNAc:undecaprenyl-phosphate GlcNAc-1-phosphate transferase
MTLSALLVLAATGLASWLVTAPASRLGLRLGLVDLPSTRRTRARAIPTTGGLVVFGTTTAALVGALFVPGLIGSAESNAYSTLIFGGSLIVLLGMFDDRLNLRPVVKLIVQTAVAVAMVRAGIRIEHVRFLVGPVYHLGWLGVPLTVFWFVALMNIVNLIDGLDGLAGGIAAIGALSLLAVGFLNNYAALAVLAAAVLGSTVGFLLHNFREGNVYLGDAGSMVLGFFIAGAAIVGAKADVASDALLVTVAAMTVPAFDVITTIVRRARSGRGVMTPDRAHVHHRLIRFGLSPRRTVVLLWGGTLFFTGQMLGQITPHGIVYVLVSYGLAAWVGNVLLDQHRKNAKTLRSDLRDELAYLVGASDTVIYGDCPPDATLRQMIVSQIRREARFRRMVRKEVRRRLQAERSGDVPGVGESARREKDTEKTPN